jgi:hypothetical protein
MIDFYHRNSIEEDNFERITFVHVPSLMDDPKCIHILLNMKHLISLMHHYMNAIVKYAPVSLKQNNSKLFIKNKISITFSKKIDQRKPSFWQMEHQILKSSPYYFFSCAVINFKISLSFYSIRKTNDSEDFINFIYRFLVFISVLLIL